MASHEVSLYLKYPGPPVALQRLQHSFLECVIEYKSGSAGELQTLPPSKLRSLYQLKGTVSLVDDELLIQFVPKNAGLHSVRIFGDTRELCRPTAFIINQKSEVESTPYDQPVKLTSSLFKSSPKSQPFSQPTGMPSPPQQQYSPPGFSPRESMMSGPQDRDSFWKEYPTELNTGTQQQYSPPNPGQQQYSPPNPSFYGQQQFQGYQGPGSPQTSPQHRLSGQGNMARQSYISSTPLSGRPVSMGPVDEAAFAGDLFTSKPQENTFGSLYSAKKGGQTVYGRKKAFMAVDHNRVVTPDTFRNLERDIDSVVTRGHKGKQRCAICSSKFKQNKLVELGEEEYCDACFRRQFLLRSAIEHFMVPTIQECTVEVPVNKKGTKFVPARKTLPNVNLRGLEPQEVKFATREFRKFSPDDNGWINKAVLVPLMKACFSYNLSGPEIKSLLSSQALQSVMTTFGLDQREEVHEIEFLALLAFVARERQRLKSSTDPRNRFTGADLQMAYAFKNHFGTQRQAPTTNQSPPPQQPLQPQGRPAYISPQKAESARFRTSSAPPQGITSPPHGIPSQVPLRRRDSQMQQQQQRESQMFQRNSGLYSPSHLPIGDSLQGPQRDALASPMSQHALSGFRSKPPSQYDFAELQQPQAQFPQLSGMQLDNTLGYPDMRSGDGGGLGDLPEEDQEEAEMPTLPANKDPSGQTISAAMLGKRPPKKQQMMEELKLTGGSADSWMLY